MQWLLYASVLVVMAILQRLTRAGPLEARATLALGLLTLAAYLGGELARRLRLPRITGFLITGLIAGPTWLRLVRADELQALSIVATGSLVLIALGAGGVVNFAALREQRTAVLRAVAGAIAVPFVVVTFVVLTVSPWFPVTVHQPFRDAMAVALALGAMAVVSSPVVTWALITDIGTPNSLARNVVNISVVQDVAAVLLLVLVLLAAQPLASGGVVTPGVAVEALLRLGGSIAAGATLGVVIVQYVKAIPTRAVWVLVAAAFVVAQGVRLIGLEPVLMGLAAGCTLANLAPIENEAVHTALKRCTVPIHVVFFGLLGCGLRLEALNELWPWVLLLAGLRFVSLRAGLLWAGRQPAVGRDTDLVSYGWIGLVSQGGLAVTLAFVLRRAFPEWGITLESLVLASIGVHLIVGPICFQWALRRTGATPEGVHGTESTKSSGSDPVLVPGGGGV
jgi:Kef-type K+ transport system membrane component KefB